MSHAPLVLSDDDFAEDAPPGYRSQKLKDQYLVWMILVLAISFVAQMALPFVISFGTSPFAMMNPALGALKQYSRMTAWRGMLWYPELDAPGSGRNGCKLHALGYDGNPTDAPAIEIDTQPEWLLADGDRLWAVSKNEVAEVLADGSRAVVMFPTRYLENPSPPFLYEGKLAVVDQGRDESPFALVVFENGEWQPQQTLHIDLPELTNTSRQASDRDAPADALAPENVSSTTPIGSTGSATGMVLPTKTQLQVVRAGGEYHLLASRDGRHFHHAGLPVAGATDQSSKWIPIDMGGVIFSQPTPFARSFQSDIVSLTAIDNAPAIYFIATQGNVSELRRWTDGQWQVVETKRNTGAGTQSVTTFTLPDGSRTFAVVEKFGGLSQELQELQTDGIKTIQALGGPMGALNPWAKDYFKTQILANAAVTGVLVLQVLLMTWLMKTHRDPSYYKGRVAVEHASIFIRCVATFIDGMISNVPLWVIWYRWYQNLEGDLFNLVQSFIQNPLAVLQMLLPPLAATGGCLLVWGFVCWLMTAWLGGTPGKLLCGVRIVRTNLEMPGLLRALVRMILWTVEMSIMNGIIAFASIAFTQNRQRVADLVAGTVVVNAGSLRRARRELAQATT